MILVYGTFRAKLTLLIRFGGVFGIQSTIHTAGILLFVYAG